MKDWTGGYNSVFKAIGARNGVVEEREKNDFYATDPKCAADIIEVLGCENFHDDDMIWECAAGQGHLSKVFEEITPSVVYSSDLIDRGYGESGVDFLLTQRPSVKGRLFIISNPPYKFSDDFVKHSLMLLNDGEVCAFFLKLTFLEGQKRQEIFKRKELESVNVYIKRAVCVKNGEFDKISNGSAVCYAWFVFRKGYNGEPVIRWI